MLTVCSDYQNVITEYSTSMIITRIGFLEFTEFVVK